MGETTCKQAEMTVAIAVRRHLGDPFLRNPRPWCVRSAFFQRPVSAWCIAIWTTKPVKLQSRCIGN